ncbi:MAG TPA: AtzH-like domain-containing protein [Rugosimonospora sp.]|nr:AtzH-like domain-containing protein [Rugosimonospora sp.]
MEINRPDVRDQVAREFYAYEAALVANDVDRIVGFFAPDAVRFGIADHQTGESEQRRWRLAQPPLPPGRTLTETTIISYGDSTAIVTTFFDYPASDVLGRQSQTWVRLPQGWRIVTAHVSCPASEWGSSPVR